MEKKQCKTIENYVVDITTKVINGYDKLELIFGNKYEISNRYCRYCNNYEVD
jgi:hypothetical protein